MNSLPEFTTLQEAIVHFSNPDNCIAYMAARRWPDGVVTCPTCGRKDVSYIAKRRVWQCKSRHKKCQFSVKVGTIMEDSPIGLDKWLVAMWMLANCRNGVSSHEIKRALGVTQKSTWFMLHRIRWAMRDTPVGPDGKLGTPGPKGNAGLGEAHATKDEWEHGSKAVEVDEAFFGGNVENMHRDRVAKLRAHSPGPQEEGYERATRYDNKAIVVGMFDRVSRQVRAKVIPNTKRETLQREILKNVKYGSAIYTDEAVGYDLLRRKFVHETVNHAETYVRGQVHTNSLENFWSLTKRTLTGTYVAVEPFHLDRYLDEQMFRFNNRQNKNDADRFHKVAAQVLHRRLTYADLTGKTAEAARPF
ncbi:MAG TPA: IS1595 family transposase [Acidobacteriaceae bacterium]|nr:IS1595 family transposase [Acidobacteriaceae bacterium]